MKVVLPTNHLFLVENFSQTREELLGVRMPGIQVRRNSASRETVLFDTTQNVVAPKALPKVARVQSSPQATISSQVTSRLNPEKSWGKQMANMLLSGLVVLSMLVAGILFLPALYYEIFPADVAPITQTSVDTAIIAGNSGSTVQNPDPSPSAPTRYLPPVNETLPEGDWLVIPRIGVRSELRPTEDPEEALAKGIWWVPDFGVPGDPELPMIVAAHRFGWEWWWQSDYWKYNSFYNLPETEPGDRVEVISDKRKWVFEIYEGHEGDEILDYNADLILYTCKFLNSPIRHFRYARLVVDASE